MGIQTSSEYEFAVFNLGQAKESLERDKELQAKWFAFQGQLQEAGLEEPSEISERIAHTQNEIENLETEIQEFLSEIPY